MIAQLNAVKAVTGALYETHLIYAVAPAAQYVVIEAPAWGDPEEGAVSGADESVSADIRVKAVGPTTDSVLIMLAALRDALCPDRIPNRIAMAGNALWLRWTRSEFVAVDRDVFSPATNQHPAYGVDTYHLTSEPL